MWTMRIIAPADDLEVLVAAFFGGGAASAAICNRRAPITAAMAVPFEQAFGGAAEYWLLRQANHNRARVRRTRDKIERLEAAA